MCRNIKTLFNFEPPATEDEIHASAVQFVRKLSGFKKPSQANAEAFDRAVAEVTASARRLLTSLHTHAPARDREIEAEKAKERSKLRFRCNRIRKAIHDYYASTRHPRSTADTSSLVTP